jgi:DNA-binding IscR family transcriptional regulator
MGLDETVRLLGHLSRAQLAGKPLSLGRLARLSSAWNAPQVELLLSELRADGLVHRTDNGRWVLARPLARLTLYDLYRATGFPLPVPGSPLWPAESVLADRLRDADQALRESLSISLDALEAAEPGSTNDADGG